MKEVIITFRCEQKIKYDFEKLLKEKDMTISQVLRQYMKQVVEDEKAKGAKRGR
jgi:antitoxin component of RelBE/YafQ-DinJ toxin-antitoxin module